MEAAPRRAGSEVQLPEICAKLPEKGTSVAARWVIFGPMGLSLQPLHVKGCFQMFSHAMSDSESHHMFYLCACVFLGGEHSEDEASPVSKLMDSTYGSIRLMLRLEMCLFWATVRICCCCQDGTEARE